MEFAIPDKVPVPGSPLAEKGADAAIIGGGLSGLALSIQLAKAGYKVVLFEKEKYPFHKVCGEYISMESWDFLQQLGLPLSEMNLPLIKKLTVTSPGGKKIESPLDPGGFGISRFKLDNELAKIARQNGVEILEDTKVNDAVFANGFFNITTSSFKIRTKVAAGTFGKRSNLDVKWARGFALQRPNKLNNYIGLKYHVQCDQPADTIALHNFKNGYCGISKIEEDKYCLCYLTTAQNLKAAGNSVTSMEELILKKNPLLKTLFAECQFLYQPPVTISQVSFEKKTLVERNILMVGDAAGMITPLCGNGMSMALHASKIAFECIDMFLKNEISRAKMEDLYTEEWNSAFSKRLRNGRNIQRFFGKEWLTNVFISTIKHFPFMIRKLIRSTHGEAF